MSNSKQLVGEAAAKYVKTGMKIGLGTGSTAYFAIRKIGQMVAAGLDIVAVPTSEKTAQMARELNIPLVDFETVTKLDLCIDGADEFDEHLNLIKGGGGALFREKIVASISNQLIIVADETKQVQTLGKFPLPVEVVPYGWQITAARIRQSGVNVDRRKDGDQPFRTDNGNFILDCHFERIPNPGYLQDQLAKTMGVVETGLFVGMTDRVITIEYGQVVEKLA